MTTRKMHVDEVSTDVSLVGRLLAAQFPQWAALPIRPVASAGTDNALYRLGDQMAVRLPRVGWAVDQIDKERRWLPLLGPHLPLATPIQLALGVPGEGYPWPWSIQRWLPGENTTIDRILNANQAARDLAEFLTALHQIDTAGGPPAGTHNASRGVPLARRDVPTRQAITALNGMFDAAAVTAAWEDALMAPALTRPPAWLHGDMLPGNLLFEHGRLSAVIDFGALGVGDPACDLMIAWGLFPGESRRQFRAALAVNDGTWARGRGWALSQALIFIPYYLHTNPAGVSVARRTIEEVLADVSGGD